MTEETLNLANKIKEEIYDLKKHYDYIKESLSDDNAKSDLKVAFKRIPDRTLYTEFFPVKFDKFVFLYLQNVSLEITRLENQLKSL